MNIYEPCKWKGWEGKRKGGGGEGYREGEGKAEKEEKKKRRVGGLCALDESSTKSKQKQ